MAGPADEQLDVVEPTGAVIGPMPRSEVHRAGHWHQVFHCLVVRSGLPARVVLQRRHRGARSFAGKLDLTVTGHLMAGEAPLEGVRELREELGLDVDPARLVPLGRRLLADDGGEGRNREVAHVYLLADDTPLAALVLDAGEVGGMVEVATAELLSVLADPRARAGATRVGTSGDVTTGSIGRNDLVPAIDGYWAVVVTMAERFAEGRGPLAV